MIKVGDKVKVVDQGDIPSKWYEEMAAEIYNKPVSAIAKDSEERTVGKSASLGCGYGMGPDKFKADTAKKTDCISDDHDEYEEKDDSSCNHQWIYFQTGKRVCGECLINDRGGYEHER